MCLLDPCNLATTYLGAMLDEEKKEALLAQAFGKKLGDEGSAISFLFCIDYRRSSVELFPV